MTPRTKTLCTYFGGSQLYHLDTPESDLDERGVFMHTEAAYILGTKRFDEVRTQNETTDLVLRELSHFCTLLKRANSEVLEVMHCHEVEFTFLSREFMKLREFKNDLTDSGRLFNCLRGYMTGELRTATGGRSGRLGGKRHAKLAEYGFSPKNFVQLFRLGLMGINFFNTDEYIVDARKFGDETFNFLMSVKTTPDNHTVEELTEYAKRLDGELVVAFENRAVNRIFDEELLNQLLLEMYLPILTNKPN